MEWSKYLLVVVMFWQVRPVQAQGRVKTMLQQVAALQGYIGVVEKGYRIAEEGVHLVGDIKSGEFGLHRVFFGSLERVDDGVLRCWALDEARRYAALLGDRAQAEQGALRVLTTDGGLSMTDGERMSAIERIRQALRVKYGQLRRLTANGDWLAAQRKKEEIYLQTLKKMYGIE